MSVDWDHGDRDFVPPTLARSCRNSRRGESTSRARFPFFSAASSSRTGSIGLSKVNSIESRSRRTETSWTCCR